MDLLKFIIVLVITKFELRRIVAWVVKTGNFTLILQFILIFGILVNIVFLIKCKIRVHQINRDLLLTIIHRSLPLFDHHHHFLVSLASWLMLLGLSRVIQDIIKLGALPILIKSNWLLFLQLIMVSFDNWFMPVQLKHCLYFYVDELIWSIMQQTGIISGLIRLICLNRFSSIIGINISLYQLLVILLSWGRLNAKLVNIGLGFGNAPRFEWHCHTPLGFIDYFDVLFFIFIETVQHISWWVDLFVDITALAAIQYDSQGVHRCHLFLRH